MKEGQVSASPSSVIRQSDYRPPSHRITDLKLDFELGLDETWLTSDFGFEPLPGPSNQGSTDLLLSGDGLCLEGAWLNDQPLAADAFQVSPEAFCLKNAGEGRLRIRTRLQPSANTELMGLYASRGGLYTQCESEGFRRMTYFLDRPDVMTVYTVTLRAPAGLFPVLLSNGNLVKEYEENGQRISVWHDPFPKPSYLFALVAADLQCLEAFVTSLSGARKQLQVYTRPQDLCRAEFALQSLKHSVAWDERRFGLELDLERFMIVAVPDFNSGAMENKGLNLFNTKYVLADPDTATDKDYELVEAVIGHEYFHNWTGNRITCRDWFQLTLKEGLTVFRDQEFTADRLAEGLSPEQAASARAIKRIEDVRTLRTHQFPEDAGPMAHPIRPLQYQEIRNFYTATVYEKGAEVIRMLQTLLGQEGFRKGMALYVERHDGRAATCEDFVSSILDANSRSELFEPFMRWYSAAGTPRVGVRSDWDAQQARLTLTLTQSLQAAHQPLVIPVRMGLLSEEGEQLLGDQVLLLTEPEQSFVFDLPAHKGKAEPIASLLRGFSAPVQLEQGLGAKALQTLAAHDTDAFNRWEACQRLMLAQLMPDATDAEDREGLIQTLWRLAADQALSDGFKLLCLTPPSEALVAEHWSSEGHAIDPSAIRRRLEALRLAMALALESVMKPLDTLVDEPEQAEHYQPSGPAAGRRALQHLAQSLVTLLSPSLDRAEQLLKRYLAATNMTRRMACLSGLVSLQGIAPQPCQAALDDFLKHYHDNDLALDKWFTVQVATVRLHDTEGLDLLATVQSLLHHPRYDLGSPNRIRSLLGPFFMQVSPGFHRSDGAGYVLWREQLASLASRNSQLASRLARSLDRWQAFEPQRRLAMRKAIELLAESPGLPADLAEVCGRFLADVTESSR